MRKFVQGISDFYADVVQIIICILYFHTNYNLYKPKMQIIICTEFSYKL
jgi:hypothetical protein